MRIISLLPSITEIICELGFGDQLVGRSHGCDFPSHVESLPVLTKPKNLDLNANSREIDRQVKSLLEEGLSVYAVDADALAALQPDIIFTQDHCEVCAVSFTDVQQAVKDRVQTHTDVVSISPANLEEIYQSFFTIGRALQAESRAEQLAGRMQSGTDQIKRRVSGEKRKRILSIEWLDPLMTAGNWVPEIVDIAGGRNLFSEAGKHSPWADWDDICAADPDIILTMLCGYGFQQTERDLPVLTELSGWNRLQAVRGEEVYILDGHQYFNRPGPRILESTRILAEIFHPHLFEPAFLNKGWKKLHRGGTTGIDRST